MLFLKCFFLVIEISGEAMASGCPLSIFQHFFNSSVAVINISQPVFSQRGHAHFNSLLFQHHGGSAIRNHVTQGVVNIQKLINPLAAPVAGIGAFITAAAREKVLVPQFIGRYAKLGEDG